MTESLLRERDEPVPDDEELFRSVAPEDVVDGELMPTSIDLQGHSVYRNKYCPSPSCALVHSRLSGRDGHRGVVAVCASRFPPPLVSSTSGVVFEAFVVDEPDAHIAHAEVRIRRETDRASRESARLSRSPAVKLELKVWLAKKMAVVIDPHQVEAPPDASAARQPGIARAVEVEVPHKPRTASDGSEGGDGGTE